MRRIVTFSLDEARRDSYFAGTKLTTLTTRDYRLMRAVIRALEIRRQNRWVGADVAHAIDAFNKPRKTK